MATDSSDKPAADMYSLVACFLSLYFGETFLAGASGFVWRCDGVPHLISNWHVLSGRNAHDGSVLHPQAALPSRIEAQVCQATEVGDYEHWFLKCDLRDQEDRPWWYEHPTEGRGVDVAALPLLGPKAANLLCANDLDQEPDMAVEIGDELFVLGYPLYPKVVGQTPIWKRASIASELALAARMGRKFFIDTATRNGMSGSLVIARQGMMLVRESGESEIGFGSGKHTRVMGVYSGRLGADKIGEVQLGVVWEWSLIDEICRGKRRAAGE
jgi:hypothetical protein